MGGGSQVGFVVGAQMLSGGGVGDGVVLGVGRGVGVGGGVGGGVGAQVGAEVGAQVGAVVGPQVGAEVGPQVGAEVGPQVGAEVGPQVGAEVGFLVVLCGEVLLGFGPEEVVAGLGVVSGRNLLHKLFTQWVSGGHAVHGFPTL